MLLTLLAVALATGLCYAWKYMSNVNKYWDERGIPNKKPVLFFGNSWPIFSRQKGLSETHRSAYEMFPDSPFFGFYDFMTPFLVIKDLEHVERVLVKDFHHFVDHGFAEKDEVNNPLDINLFNMTGRKWKAMRNKLSPMFTTGKLRHMVPQMNDPNDVLFRTVDKKPREVEMKDKFQRLSMDIIASCAFGLNVNTMEEEEESEFQKMGRLGFRLTPMQFVRFFMNNCCPSLCAKLRIPQNNPQVVKYFSKVLRETLAYRKSSKLTRKDFVQLFVTLQEKGSIEFEGDESDDYLRMDKSEKKIEHYELTEDKMLGQAFVFLVGGFDANASMLTYLCYELATQPELRRKAREEVARVIKSRGGVLDYDALKEMTYLDQCVKEVFRLHTIAAILFRVCTKDYTFPGTELSIKAGQRIYIPVAGIHHDPKYYPDPEKFNPERFAPGVTRPNCSYLPFGDGPRICIAMRFALAVIKTSAARILLDYDLTLSPKTKLPIMPDPTSLATMPKNPMYFDFTKRMYSESH